MTSLGSARRGRSASCVSSRPSGTRMSPTWSRKSPESWLLAARASTYCGRASLQARSRARRRSGPCRSSRSSRATGAARTPARSAMRSRTGRWTPASPSAPGSSPGGSRACRPARASWPTPTRPPSTRNACESSPPSRRRWPTPSRMERATRDSPRRQLRQLHVQPRPSLRGAGSRGDRAPKRRDRRGRRRAARAGPPRDLPRAGTAGGRRAVSRDRAAPGATHSASGRLSRPPGDRAGVRRRDRPGAQAPAREGERRHPRRPRDLRGPPGSAAGRPLSLAGGHRGDGRARGLCDSGRRRGHGGAPPRGPGGRHPVPSGVGADPGGAGARPELPGGQEVTIQEALAQLLDGRDLTRAEARDVMNQIMSGEATPAQMGGFLVALRLKGERAEEIAGCAEAMREHVVSVRPRREDLVDTAGTGGDGARTFNISTTAALVAAAAGAGVAKHGNRAVSSASGSADVLEALGFRLDLAPPRIEQSIDELGFGFLFAQAHHPAMRHAAPVRRELATRTVFNVLGPLTNPAGARALMLGVYSPALTRTLAEALVRLGAMRAYVVHGAGGIDELSPCGPNLVCEVENGSVREYTLDPLDLGIERCDQSELRGGDPTTNAQALRDVLTGVDDGGHRSAVILNAAGGIAAAGHAENLREGIEKAREAIDSGAAAARMEDLVAFSQEAPA